MQYPQVKIAKINGAAHRVPPQGGSLRGWSVQVSTDDSGTVHVSARDKSTLRRRLAERGATPESIARAVPRG